MPRYKRIALDVDGVLADFCWEFTKILHDLDHSQYRRHGDQVYSYDFGADEWTLSKAWEIVKQSENWWETLTPLVSWETAGFVKDLVTQRRCIFITSRIPTAGDDPWLQTYRWLQRYNFLPSPCCGSVLFVVSREDKHRVMRVAGTEVIVEDSPDVIDSVLRHKGNVIVRDWPYNRDAHPHLPRVRLLADELPEYLEEVEHG